MEPVDAVAPEHVPDLAPGEPVAIIGAGAMGMLLGGALARAGHPLVVHGGTPLSQVTISDEVAEEVHPVRHLTRPEQARTCRLVVVAVKAQHTAQVADWLQATVAPDSIVLVAQNGIEHRERVAPFVGAADVVPAIVYVPVDRPSPGHAVVHRPPDRDLTLPADAPATVVAEVLRRGGLRVESVEDFTTAAWRKVLTNLGSNPITTLTGRRTEVVRDPGVARYASRLLGEAAAIARAEGAAFDDEVVTETIHWLQKLPDGSSTSMLQDRLAGRELEHDALTGAILRAAARHGVDAPHVDSLHALLGAVSDANRG